MRKIVSALVAIVIIVGVVVFLRSTGRRAATVALDKSMANLPPGFTATHGDVAYDPILGTFSVSDLTLRKNGAPLFTAGRLEASGMVRGADPQLPSRIGHLTIVNGSIPPGLHAGRLELDGLALADLRDVVDPAYYPNGKPAWTDRRVLIEHADVTDLAADHPAPDGDQSAAHIKHIHIDGYAARPFDLPPTPENRKLPAFWAAVGRVTAEKSASAEKIDLSPDPDSHFTVATETIQGVDGGRIGSIELHDLRADRTRQGAAVKLQDVSLQGVDATDMLPILANMPTDPKTAGRALLGAFHIAKTHLAGADITPQKGPHVTLASLDATQERQPDGKKASTLTAKSFTLAVDPTTLTPVQAKQLQSFGMNVFTFDLDVAGTYDPDGQRTTLSQYDLVAEGLGTLHVTATVTGGVAAPGQNPIAALQTLSLGKATLRWDDHSLTNRLLALGAASKGTTPDALRAQLAMGTLALTMFMPEQPDAASQVNAFLTNPKTLTITLAPSAPVSLMTLAATPAAQRAPLLGVHIQAE
jgi:hypothetical protein